MKSPAYGDLVDSPLGDGNADRRKPRHLNGFAVLAKTTSRRTMLKGAAATGLTAATAGIAADILFAGPASAATTSFAR